MTQAPNELIYDQLKFVREGKNIWFYENEIYKGVFECEDVDYAIEHMYMIEDLFTYE